MYISAITTHTDSLFPNIYGSSARKLRILADFCIQVFKLQTPKQVDILMWVLSPYLLF